MTKAYNVCINYKMAVQLLELLAGSLARLCLEEEHLVDVLREK